MAGRRGWCVIVSALALLVGISGCAVGGPGSTGAAVSPGSSGDPDAARLHRQAQAALVRWADAVASASRQPGLVPVGELTGQVGDWEADVGDNDKPALMAGMVQTTADLPAEIPPDGEIRWTDGTKATAPLMSAQEALSAMKVGGGGACPECVPLQITGARLTTGPVETTRGPATAPVWAFTVKGTAVQVTRVAIAGPVTVVPPTWDPNDAPVGISVESASGAVDGRQLTVTFTGAPATGDQPCGADYTAEAVESSTAIVVIVTSHVHGLFEACSAVGALRTATVDLAAPLGARAVLEVKEGLPVQVLPAR
jgi:hypothetical protein